MPVSRAIRRVIKARPTLEGAGVRLKRGFGFEEVPLFDPFLLLDDFHSADPADYLAGFPWHPHRGIETITYVLHGTVEHGDSMGNSGAIAAGDVQWMTAGSGIVHQEMPKGDGTGLMWGFQLWANLPASHKMMDPRYREVKNVDIPEVWLENGACLRVISGEVDGTIGPVVDIVTEPQYLDITLPAGQELVRPVRRGHTAFAYVIEGTCFFEPNRDPFSWEVRETSYFDMEPSAALTKEDVVLFGDGDQVLVSAGEEELRFLLVSGRPIGEPVAWYGPIVMNTREELRKALDEYRDGTFIKRGRPEPDRT
jgi:quercetin 2,3-dioxygenase